MAKSWQPGAEPASSLCAPAAVLQLESGLPGHDLFLSSFPEKEKRECQAVVDGLRETLDVRNATIESLQKMLGDTEMLCSSLKVPTLPVPSRANHPAVSVSSVEDLCRSC